MTLTRKTTVVVGTTLLGLICCVYAVAASMLLHGFRQVESGIMHRNVQRVNDGLKAAGEAVEARLVAWISSAEAVELLSGAGAPVVAPADPLSALDIDYLAVFATDATPLLVAAGDDGFGERAFAVLEHAGQQGRAAGLLAAPGGLMLVVARTATVPSLRGAHPVTVIFGERFDAGAVDLLAQRYRVTIQITPLTDPMSDHRQALAAALATGAVDVDRARDGDVIDGGMIVRDAIGEDSLLLSISMPRYVQQEARHTAMNLLLALLVVGAAGMIVTLVTLRHTVLRRVAALHQQITHIDATQDLATRVQADGRDEITGLARGINSLLTAIERTRSELARGAERVRLLVGGTGVIVWEADASTLQFTYVGGPVERILGYRASDWTQPGFWLDHVHPDDREATVRRCTEYTARREDHTIEYRMIAADGRAVWIQDIVTIDRTYDPPRTLRGVLIDISERRRGEARLRAYTDKIVAANNELEAQASELAIKTRELDLSRQAAEAANRAKSDFLANMSHEIRTPISAIVGFADIVLDGAPGEDDRRECLRTIRANADHLLGVINDILDLSKIEAGRMSVERVHCCPLAIVQEAIASIGFRAAERGLALTLEPEFPLPQSIRSDPTRVRQVLLNLLGNAIKFTPAGSIAIRVRLLRDHPTRIAYDVHDTGIGIDPAIMERLFRPFTQADSSSTRAFGGTGLGLTISRKLARELGGDVTVRSAPGEGSTFSATFATGSLAGIGERTTLPPEAPAAASLADTPALVGVRVLLAEDGHDNRRLLSRQLHHAGAVVEFAENGALAVEQAMRALAEGRPYHVILMDMQMPVIDGYAATAMLRSRGYAGPVVAITAHAMSGDRERCLVAGCDDYLAKPTPRARLIQTCATWAARNDGLARAA